MDAETRFSKNTSPFEKALFEVKLTPSPLWLHDEDSIAEPAGGSTDPLSLSIVAAEHSSGVSLVGDTELH